MVPLKNLILHRHTILGVLLILAISSVQGMEEKNKKEKNVEPQTSSLWSGYNWIKSKIGTVKEKVVEKGPEIIFKGAVYAGAGTLYGTWGATRILNVASFGYSDLAAANVVDYFLPPKKEEKKTVFEEKKIEILEKPIEVPLSPEKKIDEPKSDEKIIREIVEEWGLQELEKEPLINWIIQVSNLTKNKTQIELENIIKEELERYKLLEKNLKQKDDELNKLKKAKLVTKGIQSAQQLAIQQKIQKRCDQLKQKRILMRQEQKMLTTILKKRKDEKLAELKTINDKQIAAKLIKALEDQTKQEREAAKKQNVTIEAILLANALQKEYNAQEKEIEKNRATKKKTTATHSSPAKISIKEALLFFQEFSKLFDTYQKGFKQKAIINLKQKSKEIISALQKGLVPKASCELILKEIALLDMKSFTTDATMKAGKNEEYFSDIALTPGIKNILTAVSTILSSPEIEDTDKPQDKINISISESQNLTIECKKNTSKDLMYIITSQQEIPMDEGPKKYITYIYTLQITTAPNKARYINHIKIDSSIENQNGKTYTSSREDIIDNKLNVVSTNPGLALPRYFARQPDGSYNKIDTKK